MKSYRVNYIDGYDFRYKSFEAVASNEIEALERLLATYKDGDTEQVADMIQIAEIIKLDEKATDGFRVGSDLSFHIPFSK